MEKPYSLKEALWYIEEIRKQRGWTYEDLAKELGVSDRFLRYFRSGERTSYPVYKKLTELYRPVPPPPPPPKIRVQCHPYIAEDETPKLFKNLRRYMRVSRGTLSRSKMQGEPVQLTLSDFMKWDKKKEEIKEGFVDQLVNDIEDAMSKREWKNWMGLKGKAKIKRTLEEKAHIMRKERETIENTVRELERVKEEYRPIVFRIAREKTPKDKFDEFDEHVAEIAEFFIEREKYKKRPELVEMRYTREYLRDLGLTPEEIEKYRVVRRK